MDEVTVVTNNGEMVTFSDGTTLVRQRIRLNKQFAKIWSSEIPQQAFKAMFVVGDTIDVSKQKWGNPSLRAGEDGVPIGTIMPTKNNPTVGDKGFHPPLPAPRKNEG
jgi:hypothetical protein